jgi:lysophospholipase L1-like esterase
MMMMRRRFLAERNLAPLRRMSRSRIIDVTSAIRQRSNPLIQHFQAHVSQQIRPPVKADAIIPSPMLPVKLKRVGQAFVSVILLSVMQGLVALYRYRNDARGRLAYPDGLTLGKENYDGDADEADADAEVMSTVIDDDEQVTGATSFLDSLLSYLVNYDDETREVSDGNEGGEGRSKCTTAKAPEHIPSLLRKLISTEHRSPSSTNTDRDPIRVLVIGDSLAIGVGCIETFHVAYDNTPSLVENTGAGCDHQGPVFPQVLARTLSRYFRLPVQWRSAGVDGGDVYDIRSLCLDVVEQECSARGVDIVVVLFGMNDLKRLLHEIPHRLFFDRETQGAGRLNQYRQGIEMLLADIRSRAPGAVVVFPEMLIQTSIFPLGLMMDFLVGLWERLKKMVVRGRNNAMYLEINSKEISRMYRPNSVNNGTPVNALMDEHGFRVFEECDDTDVLLSPDGVHPNKKLYKKWAELIGRKLYVRIHRQKGLMEQSQRRLI